MAFTQHIVFHTANIDAVHKLMDEWHRNQAGKAPGYLGARILQFREHADKFVAQVDFSSWDEAQLNNDRPETQQWAQRFMELIDGEAKYEDLNVLAVI